MTSLSPRDSEKVYSYVIMDLAKPGNVLAVFPSKVTGNPADTSSKAMQRISWCHRQGQGQDEPRARSGVTEEKPYSCPCFLCALHSIRHGFRPPRGSRGQLCSPRFSRKEAPRVLLVFTPHRPQQVWFSGRKSSPRPPPRSPSTFRHGFHGFRGDFCHYESNHGGQRGGMGWASQAESTPQRSDKGQHRRNGVADGGRGLTSKRRCIHHHLGNMATLNAGLFLGHEYM